MSKKTITKPAVKADTVKSELHGNAAVLGSPLQQVWKKKRGFCIVKGCRNKADKGHFCSQHASARTRLKAKGEKVEEPVDFEAVAAAKPKAVKKAPAKKVAAPKAYKPVMAKMDSRITKPKVKKAKAKKDAKVTLLDPADLLNGAPTVEPVTPSSLSDDSTLL
jgi:hypothetical protein